MGPSEPEGPFLPEHGRISVPVGVIGVQVAAELLETADNIFYTYIGSIFEDFNKIGTLIFLLVFSTITIKLTKIKNGLITFPQIIILCLCARVLVIPTFYTYTSLMAQTNLLCVLCFSMVIYLKK